MPPLYPLILAVLTTASSTSARRLLPSQSPLPARPNLSSTQLFPSSSTHVRRTNFIFGVISNLRGGDLSEDKSDQDDDKVEIFDELSGGESSEAEEEWGEDVVESKQEEDEEEKAESIVPVKLTIRTNLNCPISDQSLEFTASGKRTVESLKQAISKTMRGRPPLQTLVLKHSGRTLYDDETVSSLSDIDSDSDSDDEDTIGEEDYAKLKLTLDILPPIDPKFGTEFQKKADKMSTKELLGAYCLSAVGMRYGLELGEREMEEYARLLDDNNDDGDEIIEQEGGESESLNQSLHIRKQAVLLQKQMEKSFGDKVLQLMDEEHARVQAFLSDDSAEQSASSEVVYGLVPEAALTQQLRKKVVKGGAAMNIKRVLQRNMNVNWADTTRNSLLFLFFGYFGGRNSFSRTFLLLSAPLCFFIQTRPVKVAIKQAFYAIGEPPGILLSLLPAPQQAIMSLDYAGVMKGLYGDEVIRGESWYEDVDETGTDDFDEVEDVDEYDEEYDSDNEY